MKKKTFSLFMAVLLFAVFLAVIGLLMIPCPDTVMTTEANGLMPYGTVEIPYARINAALYPVHVDGCCDIVLWNGGRILADNEEAFAEIELWYTAYIEPEGMTLECISIDRCVRIGEWLIGWRGLIQAHGDVLIVSGNRVYRFVML